MKKLLIALLVIGFISSCKPEDVMDPPGYVTDNLNPEPKRNGLLIMGYGLKSNPTLTYEILRKLINQEYPKRLNNLSFVMDKTSPFFNHLSDSLLVYYQLPMAPSPYFIFNDKLLMNPATELFTEAELYLNTKKPLASVAHTVSQDDTSWVVDSKVEMYADTLVQPHALLIETYMTADIQARVYGAVGLDLRFQSFKDLIKNTDSASYWDLEAYSLDSTVKVIKKEQAVYNNHLFLKNNNSKNIFGTPLSSYWVFAGDFHEGDVIGTADTPIRHHFNKLEKGEFDYKRKLRFVTVIWILNPMTNTYDYVNSYSTGKTY